MNTSDSERLAAFLEANNFSLADKITEADLAIFNTCGIKQTAENRAYGMINNLRKEKKQKVKIVMTGCLASRPDVQKRMKSKVDLFTEIKNFPEDVASIIHGTKIPTQEKINYLSINPKYDNTFQAYVPIMTGCNNFCAYCVVPHARGREVSRPAEEIIKEIKVLVKNGYKHIFLLGQNVNSYADQKETFSSLLKKTNAIPGSFWISFTSNHPKDVTSELIETVARCKKVCENFHLPIQAGNDEILKKMNRRYTAKHYLKTIKEIKAAFKKYKPGVHFSISSDIIVGFPGETKKQFLDSAEVMQKAKFDMVYFGQFSPRPGTTAWDMKDNVSQKEKQRREIYLNEILKETALANNKKYLGEKIEVLIEKEKDGFHLGKTRTGKNVKINSKKENLLGKIVKVKITKISTWNLEGIH